MTVRAKATIYLGQARDLVSGLSLRASPKNDSAAATQHAQRAALGSMAPQLLFAPCASSARACGSGRLGNSQGRGQATGRRATCLEPSPPPLKDAGPTPMRLSVQAALQSMQLLLQQGLQQLSWSGSCAELKGW